MSDTRCVGDLMDLVVDKNNSHLVLGGLKPSQSYLITALERWMVGDKQAGYYPIQKASIMYVYCRPG